MNSSSVNHPLLKVLRAGTFISSILLAPNAWSGGLFASEHATTDSVGTAGVAGITNLNTAEAGITNPAGLTGLKARQLQLGAEIIDLTSEFNSTSPTAGKQDGGVTSFVPSLFYAYPLNDKIVLGGSFHISGALGIDFGDNWAGRNFINDAEFAFINLTGSIGYQVNKQFSIGGALVFQQFLLDVATNVPPLLPGGPDRKLATDGDDVNPGFTLGLMYHHSDATRVGFHYTGKIEHDLDMDINVSGSRVPVIDEILSGNIVIEGASPASFTLGVSHQLDKQWRVMAKLAYEKWSEFGALVVKTPAGASIDANMNLDDIYDIGVAAEYATSARTLYFGVSFAESMVSDENRIISLPADTGLKLGVGAEWPLGNESYYGFAYELVILGDAPLSQSSATETLTGEMSENHIHFISASYRY